MLKAIKEFGKYVKITGVTNARIGKIGESSESAGKKHGVQIQVLDADLVATWQHLYFAVLNALTAFKNDENISRSLAMETLLYVSAQHQIRKATEIFGIKPQSKRNALVIIGDTRKNVRSALSEILKQVGGTIDESMLGLTSRKIARIQKTFGISKQELESVAQNGNTEAALVDLVIERMALLAAQR